YVETSSDVNGWIDFVSKLDLDKVEVEDGEAILRGDLLESGELRIPIDESGREKSIEKSGKPNKGCNADKIDWEIVINKEKIEFDGVIIKDVLPEGTAYEAGSLEVYKVKTTYSGKVIEGSKEKVEITSNFPNGELNLENIKDAYLIKYTTTV